MKTFKNCQLCPVSIPRPVSWSGSSHEDQGYLFSPTVSFFKTLTGRDARPMFEQNFLSREALLALWLSAQEQVKGLFSSKLEREGRRHLQISMQDDDQLLMMVKVVPSESNHCSNNASGNCTKSHHPH